jgi:hypothetical protein
MTSADQYYIIAYDAVTSAVIFNDATSSTSATLNTAAWPNSINWTAAPYRSGTAICTSAYINATR